MGYKVAPYLNFADTASAAMEFYRSVLGGELTVSTMGDIPYPGMPDSDRDKVMHAQLTLDSGFSLMAADTPAGMARTVGDSISVSLFGDDAEEMARNFAALADGGRVVMPFEAAPWGDRFGMLVDRFGVPWMLNASSPADTA